MSGRTVASGPLGFEAFGTSCGLALVAGALAAVVPSLAMLTAALVALALAGWASLRRRAEGGRTLGSRPATYALPLAALTCGALVFVDPADPFGPWKALALGLTVVPLWAVERRRVGRAAGRRGGGAP
jgi:hypothetical protein